MTEEFVIVRVAQGFLKGRHVVSSTGTTYFSFQGVPYARPPVGPLRFKVAQQPESWEGTRDALEEGPPCPQIDWIMNLPYRGNEDCLHLNVYTPKLSTSVETVKIPVMVWIHGGGFQVGSGSTETYGPDYLVGEGVILVTINYRLGIFGFLSLEDESQPYNLGLKDQVAGLRWIKENIVNFGGDPNNVTIFGESAGSASVHYHMLSPMSKGLFHKAIMQSGCALNGWPTGENPKELAVRLAKELGCDTSNTKKLLTFLSTVPSRELIETLHNIFFKQQAEGMQHRFGPVPETGVHSEDEVFLPDSPQELMKNGEFNSVPCIIGMTSQEGIFYIAMVGILKNPSILRTFDETFECQIPKDLNTKRNNADVAEEIKKFYFGNQGLTETSVEQYIDFASDIWFTRGVDQTVKILSSSSSPVYYYYFNFSGRQNIFKNHLNVSYFSGASHMDELGYLFTTTSYATPAVIPDSLEWLTLKRMIKLWTNFAKTGNPTPTMDTVLGVQWPPYSTNDPLYLNINKTLSIQKNLYEKRVDFWNNFK